MTLPELKQRIATALELYAESCMLAMVRYNTTVDDLQRIAETLPAEDRGEINDYIDEQLERIDSLFEVTEGRLQ